MVWRRKGTDVGVIAVYSIKGGVGKTTIAFDLAWRSATYGGHRTLLWDLDLQGGAAFLLGERHPQAPWATSAFRPGGLLRQQIRPTRFERLSLLPADQSLRLLPNLLSQLRQRQRLTVMAELLSGEFTRIVLDCPPALNEISDQIIAAADLIVVPLSPSPLAMRAFDTVRDELQHNHVRPPPLVPVLSMVDMRRKLHREALLTVAADWPAVPFASSIEQMADRRAPIDSFAADSKGARALALLHSRVEERLAALPPRPVAPPLPAPGIGRPHQPQPAPRRASQAPQRRSRMRSFVDWLLRE